MKRRGDWDRNRFGWMVGGAFGALLAFAITTAAEPTAGSPPASDSGFEPFRVIVTRNIFDPGRRVGATEGTRSTEPPPGEIKIEDFHGESLSILGVLVDGIDAVVFIGSSDGRYDGVVTVGETIAGCRVLEARTDAVRLGQDGQSLTVPVGATLRRYDNGGWQIAPAASLHASGAALAYDGDGERQLAPAGETAGDGGRVDRQAEDILARLREQRRRELEQ